MSIDYTTDVGIIRLLIKDVDEPMFLFTDDEVNAFFALEGDRRRAAALALETVASDTAMTARVTEFLGLKVDGAKASEAILKRAGMLREQAVEAEGRDGGLFDWSEQIAPGDDFAARERLRDQILRGAV